MHWIYLIHEFHNLSWITEINELFHDILIYWDAPACPIFFGNVHILIYFVSIFVHAFSSQSLFLLYKDVLFGCHNFTEEDKDKYYLIKYLFFLQNYFYTNVSFKVLIPTFLFSVRTLNPTWTLFLHPTIPKPLKLSHCVIFIIFSWFCN